MKKALSLLLALVVCLSLCACGSGEQNDETHNQTEGQSNKLNLCQEWKAVSDGQTINFDKEGKFYINGDTYTYEYDEETNNITVDISNIQIKLPVTFIDGVYHISIEGKDFVPASEYERLRAEYAETMMVIPSFDGEPALNMELIKEHIERIELTVDNWNEYIKEYSYDVDVVTKDAFGEITNTETVTVYRLGYGTGKYYCLDATIELKHKETGEIVLFTSGNVANAVKNIHAIDNKPFHLDDYECTRIQGYIYFINYSEEVMTEVLNVRERTSYSDTNAWITITSDGMEGVWSVDCDAKVIESESENWRNYFE